MKIKLKAEMELEIFVSSRKSINETFPVGTVFEFDICDGKEIPEASEIQFGDGTVCFVTPDFWSDVEILEN